MPPRLGGLGISIPTERCKVEYKNSRSVTEEMVNKVKIQDDYIDEDIVMRQKKVLNRIKTEKPSRNDTLFQQILLSIDQNNKRRILEASVEKGASNWLTVLPIKEKGFCLKKQAF